MGTDIHWAAERRHQDGSWQKVMSKARTYQVDDDPTKFGFTRDDLDVLFQLCSRNYERFYILSGLRGEDEEKQEYLAVDDLPADISDSTRDYLDDHGLHSPGHLTLGQLRAAVANPDPEILPDEEAFLEAAHLLKVVESLFTSPKAASRTLSGPAYTETGEKYPEMNDSAHGQMARVEYDMGLLPVADDTARIVFAYDN